MIFGSENRFSTVKNKHFLSFWSNKRSKPYLKRKLDRENRLEFREEYCNDIGFPKKIIFFRLFHLKSSLYQLFEKSIFTGFVVGESFLRVTDSILKFEYIKSLYLCLRISCAKFQPNRPVKNGQIVRCKLHRPN